LSGCINDSDTIVQVLKDTFQFQSSQIQRLRDDNPQTMPTKANVLAGFKWLTQGAEAGDELFLHYSGHGGQQEDTSGDEQYGKDDTLIPCDFSSAGQIIDDELYDHLVKPLPPGCRMWVILDCCHSGTALDLPFKAQVGYDGYSISCMELRKKRRQMRAVGATRAHVIMLSGCKDTQTSADIQAGSLGATKASGAMTTAFKHCITPSITCMDLLLSMRKLLKSRRYDQVPQMSSEQFLQLDSPFATYEMKPKKRRDLPAISQSPRGSIASAPPPPLTGLGDSKNSVEAEIERLQQQIEQLQREAAQTPRIGTYGHPWQPLSPTNSPTTSFRPTLPQQPLFPAVAAAVS